MSEGSLIDHLESANWRQLGYELWYDHEQVDGTQDRDGQGTSEARGRTRAVPARLPEGREDVDPAAQHPGRRTDNGIGHYPAMGLAEARATAFERWKTTKAGGDPREAGSRPPAPTFAEAAEAVIAIHAPSWRNPKSGPQWRASLKTYVYPSLGALPVSEITPGHVMAVLEPIWNEKRETARRVKQRISAICRWAVAQGHRTDEPAGVVIDAALPRNGVQRRHMPALPYEDVAECIAKVRSSARASESSKLALEFLVLTAARSGEVRKATWTRSISTARRGRCRRCA